MYLVLGLELALDWTDFCSVGGLKDLGLSNPFYDNVALPYPLKTSENSWFSKVFKGHITRTLARHWLISDSVPKYMFTVRNNNKTLFP